MMLDIDLQGWMYFFAGYPVYRMSCKKVCPTLKVDIQHFFQQKSSDI